MGGGEDMLKEPELIPFIPIGRAAPLPSPMPPIVPVEVPVLMLPDILPKLPIPLVLELGHCGWGGDLGGDMAGRRGELAGFCG